MADGKLLPAYLAVGKDDLKRRRVLERFRARLDGPFADFDFDEITASKEMDEEGLARLLASLDQFPMGGGQRLVVVREAQELPKFAMDALVAYLADPNPDASLLLLAESLRKNTRLYKAVQALGGKAVMTCEPPTGRNLSGQVAAMASDLGLTLDYEATRELIDRVGKDPTMLSRTLRTLRDLAPDRSRLDARFIEGHVSRVDSPGPWVVADAVAARDVRAALRALNAMGPNDAIGVFTLVTRRIRELLVTKEQGERISPQELARAIGGKPPKQAWQVKNHVRDARRFTRAELVDALDGALRCEVALKGSQDSESALVTWILDICVPKSEGRVAVPR